MNIRLEADLVARLEVAAEKLGIARSTLIRMLTKRFMDHFDASGGSVRIPVEFAKEQREPDIRMVAEKHIQYPKR